MHKGRQLWFLGVCFLAMTVTLCGCEPLRKKFTRKKKEDKKEKFIPILDPIDYSPSRVSSLEQYKYHYSLWQVWSKDLGQLLDDRSMDKRRNYLYSQIAQELQELRRYIPEEHVPKLDEAIAAYDGVGKELAKPEMMRNASVLEARLRRAESFIKKELKPDVVFTQEEE